MLHTPSESLHSVSGSVDFSNGSEPVVTISQAALGNFSPLSFTFDAWVRFNGLSGFYTIMQLTDGTHLSNMYLDPIAGFVVQTDVTSTNVGVGAVANVWWHVVLAGGPSVLTAYAHQRNTAPTSATCTATSSTSGGTVNLGNDSFHPVSGYFCRFKLYNYTFTQRQVLEAASQAAPISNRGLISYLPMRSAGTAIRDEYRRDHAWSVGSGTLAHSRLSPPIPEIANPRVYVFAAPVAAPNITPTVAPDDVRRPTLHASQQMAFALAPSPIANTTPNQQDTRYPDRIDRPAFAAAQQLAATVVPPRPERTLPIAAVAHPDRVDRPTLHASQQLAATSEPPQPERTSPMAVVVHTDRVDRPTIHASRQAAATQLPPQSEERIQRDWSSTHPDSVRRPVMHASVIPWLAQAPAPERTAPIADAAYQDAVRRPTMPAALQLAATQIPPAPERTAPIAVAMHLDRTDRPVVLAAHQLAATSQPPQPELPLPLPWQPAFPDRALRPGYAAPEQPSFAFAPLPITQTVPTQAPVAVPDRVDRAATHASRQQAVTAVPPATLPNPTQAPTSYLDRVDRPALHASQQPAALSIPPLPITSQSVPTQPLVSFPDAVAGAWMHASRQLAVTSLPPAPERTRPMAVMSYQDRVDRASFGAWLQQTATSVPPRPEQPLPQPSSVYADRVPRPTLGASQQQALASLPPRPEQPLPPAFVGYPDRVVRPQVHAAHQPYFALAPQPEERVQLEWQPRYQDAVRRPWLHASLHPEFAISPAPVIPPPIPTQFGAVYPDLHRRAFLSIVHIQFASALPPLVVSFLVLATLEATEVVGGTLDPTLVVGATLDPTKS